MKKQIILTVLMFFLFTHPSFACGGSDRKLKLKDGTEFVFDQYSVAPAITLKYSRHGLTDDDIAAVAGLLAKRLSVIEQTEAQYLEMMKQLSPKDSCAMTKIRRDGKWTVYENTGMEWAEGECQQMRC